MTRRNIHFTIICILLMAAAILASCGKKASKEPVITEIPTEAPTATPRPSFDPTSVTTETMPVIRIVTDSGEMIDGTNTEQPLYHSTVSVSGGGEEYDLTNVPANVRVRGNSTATVSKKPYKISFDEKQAMLGLNDGNKFKNWCLLADYFDESMLRNFSAFKLADVLLEDKWYSSDCAHVSVYVNDQYMGVYLLCEQTQIKKNRVNVAQKEDSDTTTLNTGYLLIGQGGIWWEENYFDVPIGYSVTDREGNSMHFGSMRFVLSGGSNYSQAQRDYVSDYVSKVFTVIKSAVYDNKYYTLDKNCNLTENKTLTKDSTKTAAQKQKETVSAVFDIDAAARMCVLDEIVKNLDAMTFNLYVDLSPEGSGVVTPMAPWDFDHAMGKTKYSSTHSTSGWYATNLSESDGIRVNFLYVMLGSIDWFENMMEEVWQAHYSDILATLDYIEAEIYKYQEDFDADWAKWWSVRLDAQTGHQCASDMNSFTEYKDSGEFVVNWLRKRITWINNRWGTDDTKDKEAEPQDVVLDFSDTEAANYLTDFHNCYIEQKSDCIVIKVSEAYDPYLTINLEELLSDFDGEDYPTLKIVCKCPTSNSADRYYTELFLCTGSRQHAAAGYSVSYHTNASDKYVTYTINLADSGFWSGTVHGIRFDYFAGCDVADVLYVKEIRLVAAK